MEKLINVCPFCTDTPSRPFTKTDIEMHDKFGFHQTGGVCWKPEKGHEAYEAHRKLIDLFNSIRHKDNEIASLKDKASKSPVFKKLIGRFYIAEKTKGDK